jgi:hypothetical protein
MMDMAIAQNTEFSGIAMVVVEVPTKVTRPRARHQ